MTKDSYENDPLRVSDAEEQDIFNSSPRGTYAMLVVYAILFALLWLYFWFGLFLPAGPVR